MATGAQPDPELSTRSVLEKLAQAIKQENIARSEISAAVADPGGLDNDSGGADAA
jgi:hypothetical protein